MLKYWRRSRSVQRIVSRSEPIHLVQSRVRDIRLAHEADFHHRAAGISLAPFQNRNGSIYRGDIRGGGLY